MLESSGPVPDVLEEDVIGERGKFRGEVAEHFAAASELLWSGHSLWSFFHWKFELLQGFNRLGGHGCFRRRACGVSSWAP